MDAKTPPAHGTNTKSAQLTIGDKNYAFPMYEGTVGPDVIDISKLYGQTGMFTYDPGFTSTGSCESKITYIDGDEGHPALSRLPDRATGRERRLPRDLLPAALRRTADHGAEGRLRLSRDPPHDGARADEPLLPGLPPRRAPDGGDVRLGRRAVGVLSRLDRHLRPDAAHDRLDAHDRQRCRRSPPWPTSIRSASRSFIRRTTSTTRPTSCACALRCRRGVQGEPGAGARDGPHLHPARRPRAERLDLDGAARRAPRAPTRSPASRPASPACGARRMAAPTRRR